MQEFKLKYYTELYETFGVQKVETTIYLKSLGDQTVICVNREKDLQANIDQVLKREQILWWQKAKTQWLEDGDANTNFFHLSTIINRRHNHIDFLQKYDESWTSWEDIGNQFINFFTPLFTSSNPSVSNVIGLLLLRNQTILRLLLFLLWRKSKVLFLTLKQGKALNRMERPPFKVGKALNRMERPPLSSKHTRIQQRKESQRLSKVFLIVPSFRIL